MSHILSISPLGFPWQTLDPFLFCVHHYDAYPAGNEHMGPQASLAGRRIGMDFDNKDGWNMYHGDTIPGFPQHPHRGFETITIARQGFIDHSDSLGATARFGNGDVQWMTAGRGVVHSEMFPLVHRDQPNTTELFQIWLNLPRKDKLTDPYFTMLWAQDIPELSTQDEQGRSTTLRFIAGSHKAFTPPTPPPNSWASQPDAHVAVWTLKLEPHANFTLPAAIEGLNRVLYFFRGSSITLEDQTLPNTKLAAQLRSDAEISITNGDQTAELLLLQGRPINEPIAQHGPFVMNTPGEIRQAMLDYHQTQFGGWPWPSHGPVHPRDKGRFAIHADGQHEHP